MILGKHMNLMWVIKDLFSKLSFLEVNSFEDAIRNAISIVEDANTIVAIIGSIVKHIFPSLKSLIRKHNYIWIISN